MKAMVLLGTAGALVLAGRSAAAQGAATVPVSSGGAAASPLTQDSGIALNVRPRISPDGRSIAFITDRNVQYHLWVMNADGSAPHAIVSDLKATMFEPAWTPDGQFIVVRKSASRDGGGENADGLWKYSKDDGPGVQLVAGRGASNVYAAGVTIGFGTGYTATSRRKKTEEFALLVKAGIRPIDTIFAATRNAMRLLRADQDVGSVQAGRYADVVAMTGDPLAEIAVLQRVEFVTKGGQVIKANGHLVE